MIDKINEDLKEAMKNQDKFTLSVLRMLKSEFINESRKGSMHELTEDETIKVIKHQVKVRKDSIEEYTKYGKTDLVADLNKEVEILIEEVKNNKSYGHTDNYLYVELDEVLDVGKIYKRCLWITLKEN